VDVALDVTRCHGDSYNTIERFEPEFWKWSSEYEARKTIEKSKISVENLFEFQYFKCQVWFFLILMEICIFLDNNKILEIFDIFFTVYDFLIFLTFFDSLWYFFIFLDIVWHFFIFLIVYDIFFIFLNIFWYFFMKLFMQFSECQSENPKLFCGKFHFKNSISS